VYCSKCGSEISSAASFCAACGQPVAAWQVPSLSPVTASLPQVVTPAASAAYGGVAYAGFWLRFVAYLIDMFISGAAFVILLIPLFVLTGAVAALGRVMSGEDISDDGAGFLGLGFILGFTGIVLLVSWLYYALSESSSWQATPGKKLLSLKVTDVSGQPISFARASGRYFGRSSRT
jgi:uncharacterized RDD family membrane protein YckC